MRRLILSSLPFLIVTNLLAADTEKGPLVESLIEKLDLPRRYDESIASKAAQASGPQSDPKTSKWMHDLWIRELGWQKAKDSFIRHYAERFTESELRELLRLLDNPLVKRLLLSEADVLEATSQERAERFSKFWFRFNNLEFVPPR
jgi:hypothetical protein